MPNPRLAYIESNYLWPDFHAKFLNYWQESIADSLPAHYEARIGEQVMLVRSTGGERRFGPDVSIVRSQTTEYVAPDAASQATTAVLDHVEIIDEARTTRIEIVHRPDRRLVSVLELLSPSNKQEPGYSRYLDKRTELLVQPVHLIELDLLSGGHRLPHQQSLPLGEYYCFVSRVEQRWHCTVTAWSGGVALPNIPIPLLAPDPDIASQLQSVFEIAYARGRYLASP
ncbi:MAG: DUF4058 family protein [Pirellula sp.]